MSPVDINPHPFEEARKSTVLTAKGKAISFGNILDEQNVNVKRTLVVFIRHFFCGNCQEYVRRLATRFAPQLLPEDLSIVVIGCGAPSLINSYVELTKCPFALYTDPSTRLYKLLGMQRSLSLGPKGPAYIQHSLASGMVKSLVQGLKRIPSGDVAKAGELSVNGGELLFTRGNINSTWNLSWSHCMMNSRDHTEIETLKTKLGLSDSISTTQFQRAASTSLEQSSDCSTTCSYDSRRDEDMKPTMNTRRSLSFRGHKWLLKTSHHNRSSSMRTSMISVS